MDMLQDYCRLQQKLGSVTHRQVWMYLVVLWNGWRTYMGSSHASCAVVRVRSLLNQRYGSSLKASPQFKWMLIDDKEAVVKVLLTERR